MSAALLTELWADISWWNGLFDFNKAKAQGVQGVILRLGSINAATGECYEDYEFRRNAVEAPKVFGENVGGYFYVRPAFDGGEQALFAIELLKEFPAINFLADDAEVAGPAIQYRYFNVAIAAYYQSLRKSPLYTSPYYWNEKITGDKAWAKTYPLWQAQWDVPAPSDLPPWTAEQRVLWQYDAKNGQGAQYGNGPALDGDPSSPTYMQRVKQPTVNIDLNLADPDWVGEVCPVIPALPKVVKVSPFVGLPVRVKPNGKITGLLPKDATLAVTGTTEDAYEKVWYLCGSVWVPAASVTVVE